MKFFDLLTLATALLQREKRISCRALQREFELDDDCLQDLVYELTEVRRLALLHAGVILQWVRAEPQRPAVTDLTLASSTALLPASAERRQLTILLCDLVDSTALSMKLDPEDLNEVIRAYQQSCAHVITRFNGYIAKYLGDGMLVCFGYPRAFENAAECAVRSGLAIVDAIRTLNLSFDRSSGIVLNVRIGIATGPVVVDYNVRESDAGKQKFVGSAFDMAQTLQHAAKPNEVLIAEATRCLVADLFHHIAAGSFAMKPGGQEFPAWSVYDPAALPITEPSS